MKKEFIWQIWRNEVYIPPGLIKIFERLFNKAEIPVKYSEGFHPRPKMSFGSPISLGTEAYNEIMDFETDAEISNEEVVKRLNESAVLGFKVHKVEEVPRKILDNGRVYKICSIQLKESREGYG